MWRTTASSQIVAVVDKIVRCGVSHAFSLTYHFDSCQRLLGVETYGLVWLSLTRDYCYVVMARRVQTRSATLMGAAVMLASRTLTAPLPCDQTLKMIPASSEPLGRAVHVSVLRASVEKWDMSEVEWAAMVRAVMVTVSDVP